MTTALAPYRPRTDLVSRLRRRSARVLATRTVRPVLERGLVSFSFDDCPVSVRDNALPRLEARGWRATLYASFGLNGTHNHLGKHMSADDYRAAHARGHEIGDHTFSHLDGLACGPDAVRRDIARNRAAFREAGLPHATSFAYPYGEVTPGLKRALEGEFGLLRGIHAPHGGSVDLSLAPSQRLYEAERDDVLAAVDRAARERSWLILFSHDVRECPSDFGCTPDTLAAVIDRVTEHGLDVAPVAKALERVL